MISRHVHQHIPENQFNHKRNDYVIDSKDEDIKICDVDDIMNNKFSLYIKWDFMHRKIR